MVGGLRESILLLPIGGLGVKATVLDFGFFREILFLVDGYLMRLVGKKVLTFGLRNGKNLAPPPTVSPFLGLIVVTCSSSSS